MMLKVKRRATGSDERRKVRKRGVKEVLSIFSDLGEGMTKNHRQELAEKLSPSIISLTSFDGVNMHYKSTGIVIEECPNGLCILTSSKLVTTTCGGGQLINPPVKIEVCLPNNCLINGQLIDTNLSCNMVLVSTCFNPGLRAACLSNSMQVESGTKLLAVKRCFDSGNLMASSGVLIDSPIGVDCESTCKITMDGCGGPLIDFDGNIVGMNVYLDSDMTRYIPTNQILEYLWSMEFCKNTDLEPLRPPLRLVGSSSVLEDTHGDSTNGSDEKKDLDEPLAPECIEDEHKDECERNVTLCPWSSDDFTDVVNKLLRSHGYPLPKYVNGGMHLEGDFEEEFSIGIWRKKTRRRNTLKTCRSVVALASFNEKGRYFACTGVLIDCNQSIRVLTSANLVRNANEIEGNLRIEVCLPNKKRTAGTLQHYSLQYNVVVVSIITFDGNRAAKFVVEPQTKVAALGRVFETGNFMATRGVVTGKQSRFDCKEA